MYSLSNVSTNSPFWLKEELTSDRKTFKRSPCSWINLPKQITRWTPPPFSYSNIKTNAALANHKPKPAAQVPSVSIRHDHPWISTAMALSCQNIPNCDLIKTKNLMNRIYAAASLHYSLPAKRHRQHLVSGANHILTYIHTKHFCSHKTRGKLAQRHPFLNSWH